MYLYKAVICKEDLGNGVSKLLQDLTTLLGKFPGSVFFFLQVLKALPYRPQRFVFESHKVGPTIILGK